MKLFPNCGVGIQLCSIMRSIKQCMKNILIDNETIRYEKIWWMLLDELGYSFR